MIAFINRRVLSPCPEEHHSRALAAVKVRKNDENKTAARWLKKNMLPRGCSISKSRIIFSRRRALGLWGQINKQETRMCDKKCTWLLFACNRSRCSSILFRCQIIKRLFLGH